MGTRDVTARRGSRLAMRFWPQRPTLESLEPRLLLNGVTLITHGHNSDSGGWVNGMADAIADRVEGDLAEYTLTLHEGADGTPNGHSFTCDTIPYDQVDSGQVVVKVDWSEMTSSLVDGGTSTTDVGAYVADWLASVDLAGLPIHLVGHSRGASANTAVAEGLGRYGIQVDQYTSLDPHPVDGIRDPLSMDYGDAPIVLWDNIVFADNYWRTEGYTSLFDFTGEAVAGAFDRQLNEDFLEDYTGYGIEHSDVHLWYHGTIDVDGGVDEDRDGSEDLSAAEAVGWYSAANGMPGPRDQTGYFYSRVGGGDRTGEASVGLASAANRTHVTRVGPQWANLEALLAFTGPAAVTAGTDIPVTYRYQATTSCTVSFGFDADRNPFNGSSPVYVGVVGMPATSAGTAFDSGSAESTSVPTASVSPGTYYLCATIEDNGHTRYAYSAEPVTVEARPLTGAAVYADAALTTPGLTGSYIDATLSHVTGPDDWRVTQAVAGTRLDDPLEFLADGWGSRAAVGLTGGSDANWDAFSVQWDGYIEVAESGQRFATVSDDGSRFWIDLDQDGAFQATEHTDNNWGQTQGATIGDRTPAVAAGVYSIRIQYTEIGGGNSFSLVDSPYVPAQFVPAPDNPQQTVRVIVLSFDPRVPDEQNRLMHEVFGWSDPHDLAGQFEADLEWATGGAVDIQVVEWRDLDAFPTFTDGFRYNPDQYVANRQAGSGWHESGTDFYELVESQDLAPLINAGQVDEIWTFGDHYFDLLGEAWMGGPNAFFINGPTYPDAGFDRAIAGYGFNYERGVAEMIHNLCHRTENHGQRAFGSWNLAYPETAFDAFSSNYLDTVSGPYGVGSCHVPANADSHYDYGDPRTVDSFALDFANYPAMTWQTQPLSSDTWRMGPSPDDHRDYMNWYFSMVPRNAGTDADGRAANWFKYIWDFNSYESDTGLGRQEDAFAAGPIVRAPGGTSVDLTVRYYDQAGVDPATLDVGDVRVIAPGGAVLAPTAVDPGVEVLTTAGVARTVTYSIIPPGGAWDVSDNGTYSISLQPGQVLDVDANAFAAGEVGSFRVALYDPSAINVSAMLAAGQAAAAHTEFDIGTVENLFDGNTSTLARTPAINPADVTLAFDSPQTVAGFRSYFAAAWGDPAYEYAIAAADSQADLDGQTGSYVQLVPTTGTVSDAYSDVTLATAHSARFFRLTARRLTGDDYVHINEWQLIGTGAGETDAPTAALASVDEAQVGQTAHFLDVTFDDATGLDVPSVANGDLVITGPGGATITPTFYDVDDYTNGPTRTATFWFIPPGGAWDALDNGTYTVDLQAGAVRDVLYNAAATPQTLGTFDVFITPPQTRPPADLAENNAGDWVARADGASASTSDDASRTVAGDASVRFETDGGFDTSLAYPAPGVAEWDLTAATQLEFSVYAENPSAFNFQEGPWVRLNGADGGYFEYRYYENNNPATPLNGAVDQWAHFTIPLDPPVQSTGWLRTTVGAPAFEMITSVEFHADTWDAGFTLWYDGVSFDLPTGSAVPTGVVMMPASDTGVSDTDNVTMLDNSDAGKRLQFEVSGTVVGAAVTLYADGTAIGTSPAGPGGATVVETDGNVDLADGARSITARQTEPGLLESADSAALAVTVDTEAPTSALWSSAAEHDGAELLLPIPDDGSFSEPRAGRIYTLVVEFSEPADLSAASVVFAGNDDSPGGPDLSGITARVTSRDGDTGQITFSDPLPDDARYLVRLDGVADVAGNLFAGDNDRVMTGLLGDVNGDLKTDVFDLLHAWDSRGRAAGGAADRTRSDVNQDGTVGTLDLLLAWDHRGRDASNLTDPAPQARGSQSPGPVEQAPGLESYSAMYAAAKPELPPVGASRPAEPEVGSVGSAAVVVAGLAGAAAQRIDVDPPAGRSRALPYDSAAASLDGLDIGLDAGLPDVLAETVLRLLGR